MRLLHVAVVVLLSIVAVAPTTSAAPQDAGAIRCADVALAPSLGKDPDVNPDGSPVKITADSRGKIVPVVVVHGWTGRSTHDDSRKGAFSHKIDLSTNQLATVPAARSLIGQFQRIPGAAVFTFDYHDYSARWVDDPKIGPALGEAIDCLFKATGEKVVVVAHSMGGLATRFALAQQADRSKEVSTVVTFGTPGKGSLIAMLGDAALDAGAVANRAIGVVRLILAACGRTASDTLETGTPCDFLPEPARAFDSQAGIALRYGSPQLAALKPFPKNVKVHALAGDTVLTVPKAGWFRLPWEVDKVPVGDLVVMTDSATSGATESRTASCAYQLNAVRAGADQIGLTLGLTAKNDVAQPITSALGACFHSNLMRTIQLTNDATGIVNDEIESRQPATKTVTIVPIDKQGNSAPGYTTKTDGSTVECNFAGTYPSRPSVGRNIVQCGGTADGADVCWIKPDRTTLLCGWEPWDKTVHQYKAATPVPQVPKSDKPEPWGLELDNGQKCRLRAGGAWSGRSDDLVGAYSCTPGDKVILVAQGSTADVIDKRSRMWTVKIGILDDRQSGSPPPQTARVRVAYFAGSP